MRVLLLTVSTILSITITSFSQNKWDYNKNGVHISIPRISTLEKLDESVSENLKTKETYNITTFLLHKDELKNSVKLIGFNGISNYKTNEETFKIQKEKLKSQFASTKLLFTNDEINTVKKIVF